MTENASDQEIVDRMEKVWQSIATMCSSFTEDQWKMPTDCPGWSVQDQLSHLVGAESGILGHQAPAHAPAVADYVRNDIGRSNEVVVDWRRTWPGAKVLEEFQELTAQRLHLLRSLTVEDFAAETQTPIGPGTMTDFLAIRIFDAWVHEQDIRRAVGQSGHLDGPVAEHSVGRLAMAMPFVVGKKVQAADGATVVFEVTGPGGRVLPIGMEGPRAKALDSVPLQPTVRLTMNTETFACLGCGRWEPTAAIRSANVEIQGDEELGQRILDQMNIMI